MSDSSSRNYVIRFQPEGKTEEEYKSVSTFNIERYKCGLIAGDYIRLKTDMDSYQAGEIFCVLSGAQEDPTCLWVRDKKGEDIECDDEPGIFEYFEKVI